MENFLSIQTYGALGYSMTFALCLACASMGVAYFRAGRDKPKAALFVISSTLFAMLFAYLVLISLELPWLDRKITMPLLRTIALSAAVSGWGCLLLVLRKEAQQNGTQHSRQQRQSSESQRTLQGN